MVPRTNNAAEGIALEFCHEQVLLSVGTERGLRVERLRGEVRHSSRVDDPQCSRRASLLSFYFFVEFKGDLHDIQLVIVSHCNAPTNCRHPTLLAKLVIASKHGLPGEHS